MTTEKTDLTLHIDAITDAIRIIEDTTPKALDAIRYAFTTQSWIAARIEDMKPEHQALVRTACEGAVANANAANETLSQMTNALHHMTREFDAAYPHYLSAQFDTEEIKNWRTDVNQLANLARAFANEANERWLNLSDEAPLATETEAAAGDAQ